jgi:adenosylhomocysteine nucleosidase
MRGIPFYCIKGISDGYHDNLPDFNRFISKDGQFQLARFVFFVLFRPVYWPSLIRMGENSKKAARAIAASVRDLLDERGQQSEWQPKPTTLNSGSKQSPQP